MTPAMHFTNFGKYEIIRKLGRSLADVYLALDPGPNRRIVLKIVEQSRDPVTQLIVDAERRGTSIQQQLHALDPRILEIYDFGEQDGCFFVAMQYAEGRSLAEVLRNDHRLDAASAARYASEICSQLATLHSFQADIDGQKRAVVHGDIKPSNIQIGPRGEVWLLDFGIAKAITATRNLTSHNLGSPAYCSPERVKSGHVDPRADLWAAGVCLYEMMAGMPPYQAQTTRKLENLIQSGRPPRALPDDCPATLKAIIWKALAADSERRYASAAMFERDLRAFLAGTRTVAERDKQASWETNATVEKARGEPRVDRNALLEKLAHALSEWNTIALSLLAGLLVGLFCFIPASQALRYWRASSPLRAEHDYSRAAVAEIDGEWSLFRTLERDFASLGRLSPVPGLAPQLRGRLVGAADNIIDGYRNAADSSLTNFDWRKARASLAHALELQPSDTGTRGKLALCEGYLSLLETPPAARGSVQHFVTAVNLLPRSPDPHLGLARAYAMLRSPGQVIAELGTAERLGYKLGPREREQQGDVYLSRAEDELKQFKTARNPIEQRRWRAIMQRDVQRARDVYEPIAGFSNTTRSLQRLDQAEDTAEQIQADRERAKQQATRKKRYRRWG